MSDAALGWTDTHCHLQESFEAFKDTVPSPQDALVHARDAGVARLVCIGTNEDSSRAAVEFVRAASAGAMPPALWASVGLHPHEADTGTAGVAALLEEVMADQGTRRSRGSVVAVGECGLDYFYGHSPRDAQRAAFAEQIAIARRHDLTLVVHTRDAFDETFELLGDAPAHQRVVIHCFTGGPDEALRFAELGCFISFSGIITFKNAEPTREALRRCPAAAMLVETDAPFLAPVPHRGRANEPAYVALVGRAAAEVRGERAEELAARTSENAVRAFALEL